MRAASASVRLLWAFHDLGQHAAHVLGMEEEDRRTMCANARRPEDANALFAIEDTRSLDIGHFEAQMVLPAFGIPLEELKDRRVRAQRLDQLDLTIGRVDEANAHALSRKVERLAHYFRAHPLAVHG